MLVNISSFEYKRLISVIIENELLCTLLIQKNIHIDRFGKSQSNVTSVTVYHIVFYDKSYKPLK